MRFKLWLEVFDPNQFTIENYHNLAILADYVMDNPKELGLFIEAHKSVLKSLLRSFNEAEYRKGNWWQYGFQYGSNNIIAILKNSINGADTALIKQMIQSAIRELSVSSIRPQFVDTMIEYFKFVLDLLERIETMV